MKEFTLFWLHGKADIIKGNNPVDAFNRNGIGNGALRALDFWVEGDKRNEWEYEKEKRNWTKKQEVNA